jgi:nucleoside-diphosphate-sugar epimerase
MKEVQDGKITALIARSADFYGPSINNSVLIETVFKNFAKGKQAIWLASAKYKHSYTYTTDAAVATALLGNTDKAYNQIWHLPTAKNPFTGKEWIEAIASEMKVKPKYMIASKLLMWLYGLFDSTMAEVVEMMYQNDRDYVFDSSKFEQEFNFTPIPYLTGIKQIVNSDYLRVD